MANHYTHIHTSYHPDISLSPTDFLHPHGGEPPMLSQLGMSNDDPGDSDSVQNGFNFMPYPDTSTTASPPSLVASTDGPGSSSPHFLLPDTPDVESHQARKLRKDKLRIELSPDQPTTTQGRPRARVFVACLQWCASSPRRCLAVPISFC
jgi:hypothetical protein